MGLRIGFSDGPSVVNVKLPNPDPHRFRLLETMTFGHYTACRIHYPDCTTYGGEKVLVYRATNLQVAGRKELDPHFLEHCFSPIARFPATKEGWADAMAYARAKAHD